MRRIITTLATAALLTACGGSATPAVDQGGEAGGGAAGTCPVGTEDCVDADLGTPSP